MTAAYSSVAQIVAKCRAAGVVKVFASTQYEMGLLVTDNGTDGNSGRIVFRDDYMPHAARVALANKVNAMLEEKR